MHKSYDAKSTEHVKVTVVAQPIYKARSKLLHILKKSKNDKRNPISISASLIQAFWNDSFFCLLYNYLWANKPQTAGAEMWTVWTLV